MPRYTVSKTILRYLLRKKCADYRSLKDLIKDTHNAEGIYTYVKMLERTGLITVAKTVTVRNNRKVKIAIICINENRIPEALMVLSKGEQ
jgi:predicted transcriptional regulator YheO